MTTPTPEALIDILDQARQVREQYSALYAFLTTREHALERARASIPHPHDGEAWLSFDAREHICRHLLNIPPGSCELGRIADRRRAG